MTGSSKTWGRGKTIGATLAVGAIAAAAAPYGFGALVEDEIRSIAQRAEEGALIESWEIEEYERGWSSAKATARVRLGHPKTGETVELLIEQNITHGPFATGGGPGEIASSATAVDGSLLSSFEDAFGTDKPRLAQVDSEVGLGGGMDVAFVVSATEEGWSGPVGKYGWSQITGQVSFDGNATAAEYTVEADSFSYEARRAPQIFKAQGFSVSGEQWIEEDTGLWVGDSALDLTRLQLDNLGNRIFDASNISASAEAAINDGLLALEWDTEAGEVEAPVVLDEPASVRWDVRIQRIDPTFLNEMHDLQRVRAEAASASTVAERQRLMREGFQSVDWKGFAEQEPILRINTVEMSLPNGTLKASAHAGLEGVSEDDSVADPRDFMRFADAQAQVRAPQDTLLDVVAQAMELSMGVRPGTARRRARAQITQLANQGFLSFKDQRIEAQASYKAGAVTINGVPLNHLMR